MTTLAKLKAHLGQIPAHLVNRNLGADGRSYYILNIEIEVTHYSAYTKYELIHKNVNYGSVTAEYA